LENKNPYDLTDKAIDLLNRRAVKRFEDAKDEAALAKFDELNVLEVTRTLYDQLRKDNQDVFLELAQERYQEAEPHGKEPPDLAWLLALLAAYNAVTKVIYDNDVDRKRQYTAEGINSSTAKVTEFRRGLHYWSSFSADYADIVTDETTLKAYRDVGVKKVKWHAVLDGRECKTCKERDGKIYPINSVPPKTHKHCRCWLEAVK
jgi:SPP1 gp7 family putative phage head morphogenesis protein